jgi:hypothetical protein
LWALKFLGLPALSWPEDKAIPLSVESQGTIFRVGRRPNPWQPPDWSLAGSDGTFGNRFDDPDGTYRVLYASSQRLGCYLETLARFRVDLTLYAELSEIEGEDDFTPLGQVPLAWAKPRMLGLAGHDGKFADLYGSDWIGLLRRDLAADCLEFGITELDASVLQGSTARALTQRASRLVFRNAFDGIYYRSKYGHDIRNWALFEPFKLSPKHSRPINFADPEFLRALAIHHLEIGSR